VKNRGQARSRDTMREYESWGEEDNCITQQGVLFIGGRTPLGPTAPGVQRLGEAAALGVAPPPTLTLMGCGLVAARGRQHLAARFAPPQTLMGCDPVVAAAQSLPI
jgi:hypothetical protein